MRRIILLALLIGAAFAVFGQDADADPAATEEPAAIDEPAAATEPAAIDEPAADQPRSEAETLAEIERLSAKLEEANAVIDELRSRNRKLTDYKRVHGYVVVHDEFPRTASMKIKRDLLAKTLAAHPRETSIRELGE